MIDRKRVSKKAQYQVLFGDCPEVAQGMVVSPVSYWQQCFQLLCELKTVKQRGVEVVPANGDVCSSAVVVGTRYDCECLRAEWATKGYRWVLLDQALVRDLATVSN